MVEDKRADDIRQLQEKLSQMDEVALVVLKCHLHLEAKLDEVLHTFVPHGHLIQAASLRFYQKVQLARSISITEHGNKIWELILALNELRNKLAHSPDSQERRAKQEQLRSLYLGRFPDDSNEPDAVIFIWCTAFCMGFLEQCRKEAEFIKTMISKLDKLH